MIIENIALYTPINTINPRVIKENWMLKIYYILLSNSLLPDSLPQIRKNKQTKIRDKFYK